MGRSGATKPEAKKLLEEIDEHGGSSTVFVGNVSIAADVEAAFAACKTPIGGVVQAAMGLVVSQYAQPC